ncbi:uncharacterized protein EAF01_011687 [Botrytis porri]|uniref:FAD-binding PCMH-type domain-containing protein n=1 Tax=Botrytis porri TaxID=87229 RepID=A0A4Z1KMY7_9HELO|nr:uncharacterized protein EAF01_011687 [Botrytis porri]KAF7883178.1 hypothetical protein EAF01_011687 [Botrytis porri]TGO86828.1 hypothetical protein BPOR_0273g00070 [Botrytis porri]
MASYRIVLLLIHLFCRSSAQTLQNANCRALPEDQSWPSATEWNNLNNTVNGRLIRTVPIASPCHDFNYNATECAYLQVNWANPSLHWNSSSSLIAPYFATLGNQSCDPVSSEKSPCRLGNLVNYAVNVSTPNDAVAAIQFSKNHNIRFVIRNTGHDYLGKSTGAGSLAVWTHNLKNISFSDWNSDYFTGKAMKIGAGIQGFEALKSAHDAGFVTVGGECPTVGIAGGYTQGGGHSALSSSFGMGADQALSWEVVTAGGDVVTASRTENKDLYWALSGGGGGTYGVILSLIVRVYPDTVVSGASLAFSATGSNTSIEAFWNGVEAFHNHLPEMVDAGTMVGYGASSSAFRIIGMTAYNKTEADVQTLLANFTNKLTTLGINFTVAYTQYPTYLEHYNQYLGPLPYGPWGGPGVNTGGGRLISRSVVQENNKAFVATIRNVTNAGILYTGVALNVSSPHITSTADNALLPAWRDALIHVILTTPWNYSAPNSEMVAAQYHMIDEIIPQFEVLTPGGGTYLNEGNFRQPNWQQTFYGKNYRNLLGIKTKWDPDQLFYATTAVGSEAWSIAADGRMCRTSNTTTSALTLLSDGKRSKRVAN